MMTSEPTGEEKAESTAPRQPASAKEQSSLSTRFLWVLLGVMIVMISLPLLPQGWHRPAGGLLMIWLAYELWVLVYRTFASRKEPID